MDFTKNIVLENDRVRLEPLTQEHFEALLSICLKHPDLLSYSPCSFGDRQKFQIYFDTAMKEKARSFRYPFAIMDKTIHQCVGTTSFGYFSPENKRVEIGWTWIDPIAMGTGLNQACKSLLFDYAFNGLGFERVELRTDSRNLRSQKAMEKLGCVKEAELRSHTVMPDGHRRNTIFYGLLKSEWLTQR